MKKYIALALIATVAMGCNNDKAEFNPNEIRVEAKIPTRATLSSFEVGDKMSLYAVEYDGEIVPEVQKHRGYLLAFLRFRAKRRRHCRCGCCRQKLST